MTHTLVVGKSFSGLRTYLKDNGYEYTVLQDELHAKNPEKRLKHRVISNFKNKESLLASLDQLKQPVDGVMCVYENYILPTSWIAEALGVAGMPMTAAEACTDKELMRTLFAAAPEPISPGFDVVNSEDELIEFANDHSFPLILKPANLAKSLLVTKNSDMDELLANYRNAVALLATTYAKYAPNREPKLLVEEFMEGSIHSVDAFVDGEGTPHILEEIVDYQTGYDIGFDDNFHYSRLLPSALSEPDKKALRHVARIGCEALGMRSSPAHIEIILTKNGPRIVEIGARNGGYRERMHRYANGIDITGNHIAIALGKRPSITASENNACAVLELFPKTSGVYTGITNYEELEALPSLMYLSVKAELGSYVGKSSEGYKMCAVIMLGNSDHSQFARDLAFIQSSVSVTTASA